MLPPQFATHRIGSPLAAHTIELYLDLICPFSMKQLKGVREALFPLIEQDKISLQIILRQVPQPWHSSSTLVHEAVLGVSKVLVDSSEHKSYSDPQVGAQFQSFFFALMDKQKEYYDELCSQESPNATRERLADLAASLGIDRAAFIEATKVGKSNGGTPVTSDLKLAIRYARQNSVHVTPTVALDGLIDPSVSSSFTASDWKQYLKDKILPPGSKL